MKKRSIIAAIAVMFAVLFSSTLISQIEMTNTASNEKETYSPDKKKKKKDDVRGTSAHDVGGVYVPD